MRNELDNLDFSGYNISVAQAAKIMGKDQQYIRQGIIQGILPIGTAFKIGLAEIHYVFSIVNECEYK